MEKNTIWAIALSTVVLVGFFAVQTIFFPVRKAQEQSQAAQQQVVQEQAASAADSGSAVSALGGIVSDGEAVAEQTFTIETDKVRAVFTNRGGDIISYELKEHLDRDTGRGVEMVNNVSEINRAFAVSFGGVDSPIVNDVFFAKIIDDRTIGFYREFTRKNADGTEGKFTFVKTYSFKDGDYMFKLDIAIDGGENFRGLDTNGAAYSLRTAPQIGPKYNAKDRYDIREFIAFDGDKKFMPKAKKARDWEWIASAGKYFEILVDPADSVPVSGSLKLVSPVKNGTSDNQAIFSRDGVSSGEVRDSYFIYIGPRSESELKKYISDSKNAWGISVSDNKHYNESLPTSGILNWIEIVLKFIMQMIYKVIPNWGVSIIILTLLLRLALFPFSKKSLEGTQKMQAYQPRIKELQERYKDNPQKLQQETMALYKQIGYNPMSGCLPLLIQFVILWSMYHLFNNYFEFRGASFIDGWISDLSSTDTVLTFGFDIPWLGNELHILPILYLISQLLYGVITQNGGTATGQNAAQMKMMMYAMPIIFFFLFYNAPSGLLLYWMVSNLFQIGQQLVINAMMKKAPVVLSKNPKSMTVSKKGGKKSK
ncbi:membrane protein insertase YidC [Treponema saccharophilum]|uniref:Membrane protein insertase YidC n=1 Tax=Treponema saccharophilum DSM 2985 TaxID=907348 RepID=H7EPH1_9SPIR|nr:membrane protein insertase YidC [Treponema saccharophilum]EIC00372.1 protein translocase subunit yidC [Treponema saccharophilum DSM 2985]BDC94908.1 membrane protein insertase YidC [Treponema saccharophilum]